MCTGVLVLAATNRPHAIDAALLRPFRFDVLLFVPPPDIAGRVETLQIHTRHMPLDANVDLMVRCFLPPSVISMHSWFRLMLASVR